jgi:hypothetical protein
MTQTRTVGGERTPGLPLSLIGLAFLLSRLAVLPLPPPDSDVGIYAKYAREQAAAVHAGVPFYELHAREVERRAEKARAAGTLAASIDEYKDVEYPPLALAFMRLFALAVGEGRPDAAFDVRYYWAFRAGMAAIDGMLFVLLVVLVQWLFPGEDRGEQGQRLLLYAASTLVLWHLLYDRLDLLLTALVVLALALLSSRLHHVWSFAVLAGAILFKLVPIVLAPLWVVGAMPADRPLEFRRPRVLIGLAGRAALLTVLVVAGFLPFYLRDGGACLGFFAYHRARPLEIGSLYSSVPLALWFWGHPVTVGYSYGSINVYSPLTPVLAALSPWVTAAALLACTVLMLFHFSRISLGAAAPGATLAQSHPLPVVSYALLLLVIFVATGKVFSTQYLLWLAPLVALLPLGRRGRRLFTWTFLLICILSTILVPYLFLSDLIDPAEPPTLPRAIREPTHRLVALLVIRNLLFLGLTVGLAAHLVRRADASHAIVSTTGTQK